MEGFLDLLDRLCPLFKPYVEAIKKADEDRQLIALELERKQQKQQEDERIRMAEQQKVEEQKNRDEMQKRHLQDALNQQTFHQFKAYAEKQYPGNPEQQALLIRQLQNEHYHQYMQQLHAQVVIDNVDNMKRSTDDESGAVASPSSGTGVSTDSDYAGTMVGVTKSISQLPINDQDCDSDNGSGDYPVVSPASMWTRPDIQQFKQEVSAGKGDGVIRVLYKYTIYIHKQYI